MRSIRLTGSYDRSVTVMSDTTGGTAPVAYPQVGLTGPAPGLIADLYSVSRDLVFAKECAEAYAVRVRDS